MKAVPPTPAMPLLDLDAAFQRMAEIVRPVREEVLRPLAESLRCFTAKPVIARIALPAFDNSAVDGYAFRYADGQERASFTLSVAGSSFAGTPYPKQIEQGTAIRIATGGLLPAGADTIVMQEQCTLRNDQLTISKPPEKGFGIRKAGNDFGKGDVALPAGKLLAPQDIALIGALGYTETSVLRPIKVAVFSTGSELRVAGSATEQGQIVDTNGLMLKHLLTQFPVSATLMPALPDHYEQTLATLGNAAPTHDLIITSGGISVGSHDFVRDVLYKIGKVHFWRLAIRPGKPVLFGQIGKCLMICLPGNPVSAMITFLVIAAPPLENYRRATITASASLFPPLGPQLLQNCGAA